MTQEQYSDDRVQEIRQQSLELSFLASKNLGVYGGGRDHLPDGSIGMVLLIQDGMPDEFREILRAAAPEFTVRFVKVAEPKPQAEILE